MVEITRDRRLTLAVVPDPDREIAQRNRVTYWPTTIALDEAGRVDRVLFGVMPERAPSGRDRSDTPALTRRRGPRSETQVQLPRCARSGA